MMRACTALLVLLLLVSSTGRLHAQPGNGKDVFSTYPVPASTKQLLFYLQRNKNANTIVYEARTGADGKVTVDDPVRVEWVRYGDQGQRKGLNSVEARFAYGVKHKDSADGIAHMVFSASSRHSFNVVVDASGQAKAVMMIAGQAARLHHIEVMADESSWWPKVLYVDIHGFDLATGKPVTERFEP